MCVYLRLFVECQGLHCCYSTRGREKTSKTYDPCVANMMVNGAQCTVCWHVDDLEVSHVDEAVVTAFSLKLADLYKGRVKIHCGKVLDYLDMKLDYDSSPGALLIWMTKYLIKVLK